MSSYSDWIRWDASCRMRRGFGATAGDTMHRGLGDYNASRPCPNGLPIDKRAPGDCLEWRERVARARRDSAAHSRHIAFKSLTENSAPLALSDIEQILQVSNEVYDG